MDLIFVARSLANLFSRNCQNSSILKDQKLNGNNLTKDKYQVALGLLLLVFEVVSSGCIALHKVSMLMSMSLSTFMSTFMSMLMSMLMSVSRSMSISTSQAYPPYLYYVHDVHSPRPMSRKLFTVRIFTLTEPFLFTSGLKKRHPVPP